MSYRKINADLKITRKKYLKENEVRREWKGESLIINIGFKVEEKMTFKKEADIFVTDDGEYFVRVDACIRDSNREILTYYSADSDFFESDVEAVDFLKRNKEKIIQILDKICFSDKYQEFDETQNKQKLLRKELERQTGIDFFPQQTPF